MDKFPKMIKVRQHFTGPVVTEVDAVVSEQLDASGISSMINPGMRIALTVGSRGIANIPQIVKGVVEKLKGWGAEPFIVPAMGSHGGATAEGQVEVLSGLGITEQACGAPIHSSMEVVEVGKTAQQIPVYVDKFAWEADGIILMGRIKVHTDFKSPIGIESGLMKMAAIGLGKHKQALLLHSYGVEGMLIRMPEAAKVILQKAKIMCGIAIVENAFEQTARIEAIPPARIPERESELLKESVQLMPRLPVDRIDVLIVDEIGKDYSGTGMDTNIIGRLRIRSVTEPLAPSIKYIIAGDLSKASHGNATGIGLADITTQRCFAKIDLRKTNENVATSTFLHRAMIPLVADNDREALRIALRANWGVDPLQARVIRIPNTLHLHELYVSEAIYQEICGLDFIETISGWEEAAWDERGNWRKGEER